MIRVNTKQVGFTLIELVFAITILGIMLSLAMVATIGMLRFYVFSNQVRQNQENGRNMLDTMTREIRFGQLVVPNGAAQTNEVCVINKAGNQLIRYQLNGGNIQRTVLSYTTAGEPTACVGAGITTVSGPTTINLSNMRVVQFVVGKSQGARIEANTNATSVIISLSYITGNPDPASPNECRQADIYCSRLDLNTAINIRGKDGG